MENQREKYIVRELAKRYMEAVNTERQSKMYQRFKDTNDLKLVRPPVIIDEIPWHQMDIGDELTCVCEDKRVRGVERHFRKALYYMKHFKADNLYEPFFRVRRAVDTTGIGIDIKVADEKHADKTDIMSREYIDVLEDEATLELIHDPEFILRPDKDERNMEFYTDLLGDSIPIRLYGFGYFYYAPWDQITTLRGIEPILMDMYDRPEYLHKIIKKFTSAAHAQLDFVEKNLEVDPELTDIHCTPATISGLSQNGLKSTWCRSMAQSFSVVSPEMFEEFELNYLLSVADRFAYTYYGCCEPLDDRISVIKKIPNLRKIGCSPWANVEKCAEQIGGDYVLARKPNPAHVAMKTDPDVIRRETKETVEACIKYGCPCDFSLKDISTVSNRPENLIVWSKVVSDVLDEYFEK